MYVIVFKIDVIIQKKTFELCIIGKLCEVFYQAAFYSGMDFFAHHHHFRITGEGPVVVISRDRRLNGIFETAQCPGKRPVAHQKMFQPFFHYCLPSWLIFKNASRNRHLGSGLMKDSLLKKPPARHMVKDRSLIIKRGRPTFILYYITMIIKPYNRKIPSGRRCRETWTIREGRRL